MVGTSQTYSDIYLKQNLD